jgi:hypothetical protein
MQVAWLVQPNLLPLHPLTSHLETAAPLLSLLITLLSILIAGSNTLSPLRALTSLIFHSTTADFSLDFLKNFHPPMMAPGDNNESETTSLLTLDADHSNRQIGAPNDIYNPPMMLPFAEDYPNEIEAPDLLMVPTAGQVMTDRTVPRTIWM